MKKFIILIGLILIMGSCYYDDPRDTVEEPTKATTTYLQELPKDTVLMSVDDGVLYLFDTEDVLVIVTTETPKNNAVAVNALFLVGLFFVLIVILISLIEQLTK